MLLMGLTGCVAGYGYDDGPEWDGAVFVGGGYGPGYYRDHHYNAFHGDEGRHPVGAASDRGRASMGGGGGAGHGGGGVGGGHR